MRSLIWYFIFSSSTHSDVLMKLTCVTLESIDFDYWNFEFANHFNCIFQNVHSLCSKWSHNQTLYFYLYHLQTRFGRLNVNWLFNTMDRFQTLSMVLAAITVIVCIVLVNGQADDFPGPYCATRPGGCCKGRKDGCAVPISSEFYAHTISE